MDDDPTKKVLAALEREGVQYVVFGALALMLHGLRATVDHLSVFIAPQRDNIDRLKAALHSVFDDPCIDEITADDLLGEYPVVRYVPPPGVFHIDAVTRLGELYGEASPPSQRLDFGGVWVSVVTPETLYRMKKGSGRLEDLDDAQRLARFFKLEN